MMKNFVFSAFLEMYQYLSFLQLFTNLTYVSYCHIGFNKTFVQSCMLLFIGNMVTLL